MGIQNGENVSETCNPDEVQGFGMLQFSVPEGTVVSIIEVLSPHTLVLSWAVSHTQTTKVAGKIGLVGAWYAALREELSHR